MSEAGFQRVLAKFLLRLTKEEVDHFRFTGLKDVQQAIVDIQEQQARRKGMRNLTRVLAFVEAMDQFGKVVEVFLNTSSLLCFIWGPIKFLLQVASVWAESFDILLDAYQQIAESIPLLLQYRGLFEKNPQVGAVLEMIYEDILEFHQSALRMFGKSTLQQFFRAAWKDFKSRFQHILGDLQRHKSLIESQANILQIQEAQEARVETGDSFSKLFRENAHEVQEAKAARIATEDAFTKLFQSERNDRYLFVQNWLSAVNVKVDHEGYTAMRYGNTGHWILGNSIIKAWMDPDNHTVPIVWLNGIPGAGKTILASRVIEEVQINPLISVLFFYCKYKDRQRRTFVSVACSILAQLLFQNKDQDVLPFLHEQLLNSGEISLQSLQLCKTLLKTALDSLPSHARIYIVLDGIDECDALERRLILSTITSIIDSNRQPGKFRALFISQYEPDIRGLLRSAEVIRITEKDNEEDIKEYATQWTSKILNKFKNFPAEKQELLTRTVCNGAEGMFLFAKLVMTNLYGQTTLNQLYRELLPERFPKGLDQAYERIVERIYSNENVAEREQAQKLLGWVVCAKRPLKWHEIQGAISIDIEHQTVDFEGSLVLDVKELCGSLVERLPGDRIELVHSTAKIYLVQDKQIFMAREEGKLAALCMQYLTFESFSQEAPLADHERAQLVSNGFHAFQDYAALHWLDHLVCFLKTLGSEDLDDLDTLGPIGEDFLALHGAEPELLDGSSRELNVESERVLQHPNSSTFRLLINQARRLRSEKEDLNALGSELGKAISSSRKRIEDMSQSITIDHDLKELLKICYGSNWFKCPRHLCFYFHEGFPNARLRDQHIDRHDRPFCCSYEGCSRIQTGFSTDKELKNHLRKSHPDPESLSWKFAKPQKVLEAPKSPIRKHDARFECNLCPKRFTRGHTLKSHLRTHANERPFVCAVCGKAFARQHDQKRHEKLHSEKKLVDTGEEDSVESGAKNFVETVEEGFTRKENRKYVCKGELKRGGQWGCNRQFAQADVLGRHFCTEAGRLCIRPLHDEEVMDPQGQLQEDGMQQSGEPKDANGSSNMNSGEHIFPAALIAQYPELAIMNSMDLCWLDFPVRKFGRIV